MVLSARPGDEARPAALVDAGAVHAKRAAKIGSINQTDVGFAQLGVDGWDSLRGSKVAAWRAASLLGLRDVTLDLLDAQATGERRERWLRRCVPN